MSVATSTGMYPHPQIHTKNGVEIDLGDRSTDIAQQNRHHPRTDLLDLPNELLLTIFEHLKPTDLYALSILCRHLHRLAIPLYVARHGINYYSSGKLSLFFYDGTMGALPGLRIAPITSLNHLDCRFGLGGPSSHKELIGVKRLVKKLEVVEEVTLDVVPIVPLWLSGREEWIRIAEWEHEFLALLEELLMKSCRRMNFLRWAGRRIFGSRTASVQAWRSLHIPSRPIAVMRSLIRGMKTKSWDDSAQQRSLIDTFRVHSLVPFIPAFLNRTLKILDSSSITYLEFDCPLTFKHWSDLLPWIVAPNLHHLSISSSTIPPSHFTKFLTRHPTLLTLDLRTNNLVDYSQSPPLPKDALPLLATLKGNPSDIAYLLKRSDAFPALTRISIVSHISRLSSYHHNFEPIDNALSSIARRSSDVALSLSLHENPGLGGWLDVNSVNHPGGRPECSLRCVKSLEVESGRYYSFSSNAVALLPAWLALFPVLEQVVIAHNSVDVIMASNAKIRFVRSVAEACPRLKTLVIDSDQYSVATGLIVAR